ncbi:MAG: hypothetical protein KAR79_04245, partial [Simkaniaceae bacterium]|nr:hypothetical protein [Simkaniaceae bacterium]
NAEFIAIDTRFVGSYLIDVPSGIRRIAIMESGIVQFRDEMISNSLPLWKYNISDDASILLSRS